LRPHAIDSKKGRSDSFGCPATIHAVAHCGIVLRNQSATCRAHAFKSVSSLPRKACFSPFFVLHAAQAQQLAPSEQSPSLNLFPIIQGTGCNRSSFSKKCAPKMAFLRMSDPLFKRQFSKPQFGDLSRATRTTHVRRVVTYSSQV
jgi:hypothetical protein